MSRLRQSVLEKIRIIGNHSGCHQRADRSFFYKGKQFPVCARCTGVFIGQLLVLLLAVFKVFFSNTMGIIFLLTMGFDWFIQAVKLKESTNVRRFLTGILGGMGIFILYINIFRKIMNIFKHLGN